MATRFFDYRRSGAFEARLDWFDHLASLPRAEAQRDIEKRSRGWLIEWLQWNDPNGTYTDVLLAVDGEDPLSKEDAVDLVMAALDDA